MTNRAARNFFSQVALALVLGCPGNSPGTAPSAPSPNGESIYRNTCSVCHGDRGDGRSGARASLVPPPRDFTEPRLRQTLSREAMIAITRDGKPGTAMVGWRTQLGETQIAAVVDYIRSKFMRAPTEPGAPPAAPRRRTGRADMSLPMPKGLTGDPELGGRFYHANCATCHGARGDGKGPRAYFIKPRPRDFLSTESRATLNRPALFSGIALGRVGSEMPAWRTVLTDQQLADVAEYVFREFVRAGAVGAR